MLTESELAILRGLDCPQTADEFLAVADYAVAIMRRGLRRCAGRAPGREDRLRYELVSARARAEFVAAEAEAAQ